MKKILKKVIATNALLLITISTYAQTTQDYNPVYTAVPSLTIAPDARAGAMGDVGAATTPDVYSQYWNPAKYAFATSKAGLGLSYTPWLRKIVNDVALMQAVGYYKLGSEDNQALSASIRYFSIGDVALADAQGEIMRNIAPYEMAIDLGYSRKLTETFSGSVVVRYIRADYSGADAEGSPGNTFAADIAGYNESYIYIPGTQRESLLGLGFNISNIGGKISNNDGNTSSFIPTTMRLGASLMYPLAEKSTISLSTDISKLLVPTPPVPEEGENTSSPAYLERLAKYNNTSFISGIFKSFSDAPGGFSEELKEIMWSVGAEYDYDQMFKLRAGYFHESKMKGNRRFFSFGAGFKMSAFQLDVAYLLSSAQTSPLDQTLRFSLAFDLDGLKGLMH